MYSSKFNLLNTIDNISKSINLILTLASVSCFVLSFLLFYYHCLRSQSLKSKKFYVKNEETLKDEPKNLPEIIQEKIINEIKKTYSTKSISSINFDRVQSDVFSSFNSQLLAQQFTSNFLNRKNDNNLEKIYFTDLRHISQNGLFIIAPVQDENQIKPNEKKARKGTKLIKNLNKKVKKFIEINKGKDKKLIEDIYCLFNMNSIQQKYFLDYYGNDKNPILIARKDYKQKLKRMKSKYKSKDNSTDDSSSLNVDSYIDNLNDQIRSYLKNSKLTGIRVHYDQSGGLGRKFIYKVRKLKYRDENFYRNGSKELKRFPSISLEFYDVKSSKFVYDKEREISDKNKLQVLKKKS